MTDEMTTVKVIGMDEIFDNFYRCKKCRCDSILDHFKYCPKCGRKIDWRK